jgi:hypothetical protein
MREKNLGISFIKTLAKLQDGPNLKGQLASVNFNYMDKRNPLDTNQTSTKDFFFFDRRVRGM